MRKKFEIKIMCILILFSVILTGIVAWATDQPRGSTLNILEEDLIEVGVAETYDKPHEIDHRSLLKSYSMNGSLQATSELDLYLPAGEHLAVHFDGENKSLHFIEPEMENPFSSAVQAAIDKAPNWMENDLINVFSLLEAQYQEKWANAILEAKDPFIDEIAFCIAHLSPQYLMSRYAYVELLNLNAKLIYENDEFLEYVDVVDYGSSQTDPNYYSTTKYRKAKYIDTTEVEVPRDIYYWYIVHPKITDEIPAFIDPDIAEYTHKENITNPENGYFWREFLFYEADPGYAIFKHLIKGCKVVWNEFGGSVVGASHAIEVMNRWQGACMQFTSENDRPHQPVRIYRKHMGRCGENSDMRVAIARSALIPATSVATYSRDHVWNEFWDGEWIHWDGAIDNPMMYVDGWGKQLNSVFRWRSDGSFTCVTDRYTREYSTLNIYALDSLSNPIDGAQVILYAPGLYQPKAFDNYGVTDNEGKVTFIVAAGRSYWVKMNCDFGSVPSGQGNVLRVVGSSQDGETYNVQISVDAKVPVLNWEEIPVPQFDENRYFLEMDIKVPSQVLRGRDLFDDLNLNAYQFIIQPQGRINSFMMDEDNYNKYTSGQNFQGFHSAYDSMQTMIGFEFDDSSDWFCVFDNKNALHTLQHITGAINFYSKYDPTIAKVQVLQNFPNPLSSSSGGTTIVYRLPQQSKVEFIIYNILGQKIKTLINEEKYAGEFRIDWDGKNNLDQFVASGIYLCKMKTNQGVSTRKIMVMH